MHPGLLYLTLLLLFLGILHSNLVSAQSIELEWQQTDSSKQGNYASFDQFAVRSEYLAFLFNIEQRSYSGHSTGSPSRLHYITPGLQYLHDFDNGWAIWPRFLLMAGYEDSLTSKSLTYNPQLAVIRQYNNDIAFVSGVGALLHTTENVFYPIAGLVWLDSSTTRWSGNLTLPQGLIAYRVNQYWHAELGLKWQTRFYQLNARPYQLNESYAGAAFIKQQDILASAGARFDMNRNLQITARLTYAFGRDIRSYNLNTERLYQDNPASGYGLRVGLTYNF